MFHDTVGVLQWLRGFTSASLQAQLPMLVPSTVQPVAQLAPSQLPAHLDGMWRCRGGKYTAIAVVPPHGQRRIRRAGGGSKGQGGGVSLIPNTVTCTVDPCTVVSTPSTVTCVAAVGSETVQSTLKTLARVSAVCTSAAHRAPVRTGTLVSERQQMCAWNGG